MNFQAQLLGDSEDVVDPHREMFAADRSAARSISGKAVLVLFLVRANQQMRELSAGRARSARAVPE